jgi:hypothetical protein
MGLIETGLKPASAAIAKRPLTEQQRVLCSALHVAHRH